MRYLHEFLAANGLQNCSNPFEILAYELASDYVSSMDINDVASFVECALRSLLESNDDHEKALLDSHILMDSDYPAKYLLIQRHLKLRFRLATKCIFPKRHESVYVREPDYFDDNMANPRL